MHLQPGRELTTDHAMRLAYATRTRHSQCKATECHCPVAQCISREGVVSMKSQGPRPVRKSPWEGIERLIQLVALLVTAVATLVTAIQGAGPI